MGLFNKKELQKINDLEVENLRLNSIVNEIGGMSYVEVQEKIKQEKIKMQKEKEVVASEINQLSVNKNELINQIESLKKEKDAAQKELFNISDEVMMQSFGFYKPKYDCMNSDEYAQRIKDNREKQKKIVKDKSALNYSTVWTLDGSKTKGQAMNNDNMKMVLRAFNNECDVLIDKVKFNNIDKIKEQIKKCAKAIDKLNVRNKISIRPEYISLKIEELELVHEFRVKKQEEKEAIKAARAEEREQAKLQKEIEEARKVIKKEQSHYQAEKDRLIAQLLGASDDEKQIIQEKLNLVDEHLNEIDKNISEIDYREANQRAGYVYVISNIGSFGEGIYKIGMTRRLDPQDRVDELGDASVPFTFDVHAMIFSDDAPKLEAALHNAFDDKKVNLINGRKEFFKISLDEIERVIKENHDKLIEFKKTPDAQQFRESEIIRKNA